MPRPPRQPRLAVDVPSASSAPAPAAEPPAAVGAVGAQQAFDAWAAQRRAMQPHRFSADTVSQYASIWRQWLQFVGGHPDDDGRPRRAPRAWHAATRDDVEEFLAAIATRSRRRPGASVSDATRHRYGRVLHDVYSHAASLGWIDPDAPPPTLAPALLPRAEVPSLALPQHLWGELLDALARGEGLTDPRHGDLAWRDEALLATLLHLGLTATECASLTVASLRRTASGALRWLALDGARPAQRRMLELPDEVREPLARCLLMHPQAAHADAVLFPSRKTGARMTPRAVFHVASRFIGQALASESLAHLGPATLRNSALVRWIESGVDIGEVARRAGLQHVRSLRRLVPHLGGDDAARLAEAIRQAGEDGDDGDDDGPLDG